MNEAMVIALKWWKWVLRHDIVEQRRWKLDEEKLNFMFVDARSSPARVAAILFASDGTVLYTDGEPSKKIVERCLGYASASICVRITFCF